MSKKDVIEVLSVREVSAMRAKRAALEEAQRVKAYWDNQAIAQKMQDDMARKREAFDAAVLAEEARAAMYAAKDRWARASGAIPAKAALLKESLKDEMRDKRDASKKKHEATLRSLKKQQAMRLAEICEAEKDALDKERDLYAAAVPRGVPKAKKMSSKDLEIWQKTQEHLAREAALTK